jgi:hypothetical protein
MWDPADGASAFENAAGWRARLIDGLDGLDGLDGRLAASSAA